MIFNEFSKSYRSEDEAWFCLCRKIELPICPICHNKKVKFTGMTKNGALGYNTTCEDCSANCVKEKLDKFHKSIECRSDEDKHQSFLKRKQTNKEKYGDENYSLFTSNRNSLDHECIDINSIEDLKNNFNNWVRFKCENCGKEVVRHVNKHKHGTYDNMLCPKCKRELTCIKKYGVSTNLKVKEFIESSLKKKK